MGPSPKKSMCELAGSLKSIDGMVSQYIECQGSSGTANIHSCSSTGLVSQCSIHRHASHTANLPAEPGDFARVEEHGHPSSPYWRVAISSRVDSSRVAVHKAKPSLVCFAFKKAAREYLCGKSEVIHLGGENERTKVVVHARKGIIVCVV